MTVDFLTTKYQQVIFSLDYSFDVENPSKERQYDKCLTLQMPSIISQRAGRKKLLGIWRVFYRAAIVLESTIVGI